MTTMFTSLLEQFLTEECTTDVQRLLEEAMADVAVPHQCVRFNRFDVRPRFAAGVRDATAPASTEFHGCGGTWGAADRARASSGASRRSRR